MIVTKRRPRVPSVREIMSAKGCSRNYANTLQAICELKIDEVCAATTGVHTIRPVTFDEFKREVEAL